MQTDSNQIIFFIVLTTAIIFLLATFIITLLYLYRKKQTKHIKDLEQIKLDYEKNLLLTQVEIQKQTFLNVSQEIHDNISLSLTLAKLNLVQVRDQISGCHALIDNSKELISNAIEGLRDISKCLNPEFLSQQGLIKVLEKEVTRIQSSTSIQFMMKVVGEPVFLDVKKEFILFRTIQEAFNNILKHSDATEVKLILDYFDNHIEISIEDNGTGFETASYMNDKVSHEASGIQNMRSRIRLFDGMFKISSLPGLGTNILISIPY